MEEAMRLCPRCGKQLTEVGEEKRFLDCVCGYRFDSFLSRESVKEEEAEPITFERIEDSLSLTVKRDDQAKAITFAAMILTKTESDQINLGFQAESSAGKTYIPLEVAAYFPQEEVITIAGASPTAFFHEYGKWDKERKVNIVNLEGKVLIFLDFPDYRLIEKLRPLLSHDRKVLLYKITDKKEKSGHRTKSIELIGYPTVIFCSTKLNPDEQEKTRLLLLSPSVDSEKLKEALKLLALKVSDRVAYAQAISSDPKRAFLVKLVGEVWTSAPKNVVIEGDLFEEFMKRETHVKPRHTRDLPRIASLIKAHALLNFQLRDRNERGDLIATVEDVKAGFGLYDSVRLPNELGVSPYVMDIYQRVLVPLFPKFDGVPRAEIFRKYYEVSGRAAGPRWFERDVFPALEAAGLIELQPDPNDRRKILAYPPDLGRISADGNTPTMWGGAFEQRVFLPDAAESRAGGSKTKKGGEIG